jgi:Fe-S-cluster containining protein
MDEFVRVTNRFGSDKVEYGLGKAYLRVNSNKRCIFQRPVMGRWVCTLQGMKPMACKIFPFRIYKDPVYRRGDNSHITFNNQKYHLYLDPACKGIIHGKPDQRFMNKVVPEIMRIGMGTAQKQRFSTSKYISWTP